MAKRTPFARIPSATLRVSAEDGAALRQAMAAVDTAMAEAELAAAEARAKVLRASLARDQVVTRVATALGLNPRTPFTLEDDNTVTVPPPADPKKEPTRA